MEKNIVDKDYEEKINLSIERSVQRCGQLVRIGNQCKNTAARETVDEIRERCEKSIEISKKRIAELRAERVKLREEADAKQLNWKAIQEMKVKKIVEDETNRIYKENNKRA